MARAGAEGPERVTEPEAADPDQAWKVLTLVNDWVKHAEAKTGASLAVAGVIGGVLYNLVKDQHDPGPTLWVAAFVCGLAVLAAAACAALALVPRLRLTRAQDDPVSPLFFDHIARKYKNAGSAYAEALRDLTVQPNELTLEIGKQVHANAVVAHRKFCWVNWVVRALLVALLALGFVAAIVGSD